MLAYLFLSIVVAFMFHNAYTHDFELMVLWGFVLLNAMATGYVVEALKKHGKSK